MQILGVLIFVWYFGGSAESFRDEQAGLQNQRSEVINFARKLKQQNDFCGDDLAEGSPLSCLEYKELGLCDHLEQQYCQQSCERCNEAVQIPDAKRQGIFCEDVLLPGIQDCQKILQENLCENSAVKGIYCNKSCGQCDVQPPENNTLEVPSAAITNGGGYECEDVLLPGSSDCNIIVEENLCDTLEIKGTYCSESCGFCSEELPTQIKDYLQPPEEELLPITTEYLQPPDLEQPNDSFCEDKLLPGTMDCRIVLKQEMCQSSNIKGIYCNKSCGFCVEQTAPPTAEGLSSKSMERPQGVLDCSDEGGSLECDALALQSLKESVTEGQSVLSTWVGDNPCSWRFVACARIDAQNARVTELNLQFIDSDLAKTISGTLPSNLSHLRYLKQFYITNQNFSGSLPEEYSLLNKLVYFSVLSNELTGSLPKQYSTWNLLQEFVVTSNTYMSGPIPPEYSTWTALQNIFFDANKFYSTLPKQYSTWKNMQSFNVAQLQLYGSLPVEYSVWEDCTQLGFSQNLLTGELPKEYSEMINMKSFFAYYNEFTGVLPVEYSVWTGLGYFVVFVNELSGSIPQVYSEWEQMENFQVDSNELTGILPKEFSVMRFLFRFSSFDNYITKNIPVEWSEFSDNADINV